MPSNVNITYEDRGAWRWEAADGRTTGVITSYKVHVDGSVSAGVAMHDAIGSPDIPQYGEEWPTEGAGLFAKEHTAQIVGRSTGDSPEWIVQVSVRFVHAEELITEWQFTFRSSMEQVETLRDAAGNLLAIGYTDPDETVYPPVTVPLDALKAMGEVQTVKVVETENPLGIADAWINRINSDEFLGVGAKKLLCSEVSFEPFSGFEDRYLMRFTFLLKPETWDQVITFQGADGLIPPDVGIGNGQAVVQIYQTLDFEATYPFGEGS
jgi:hypothetical protein